MTFAAALVNTWQARKPAWPLTRTARQGDRRGLQSHANDRRAHVRDVVITSCGSFPLPWAQPQSPPAPTLRLAGAAARAVPAAAPNCSAAVEVRNRPAQTRS